MPGRRHADPAGSPPAAVPSTCRVVCADVAEEATAAAAQAVRSVLPPDELERADRLRQADDRVRTLTAQFLVRHVAAEATGGPWERVRVARDDRSRVALVDLPHDVSVSHCGDWVVVAIVGRGRVGVDVESVARVSELPQEAFLDASESRRVAEIAAPQTAAAGLWALKEAAVKLVGTGFSRPPRSVVFAWDGPSPFGGAPRTADVAAEFTVLEGPAAGYVLAVATSEPARVEVELWPARGEGPLNPGDLASSAPPRRSPRR